MKVLYFSSHYESNSFISRQVEEVSDTLETWYMCITADPNHHPSSRLCLVSYPQPKWKEKIRNKLELSDLYIDYRNSVFAKEVAKVVQEIKPAIIHCQYGSDAIKLLDNYFDPNQKYVITFRGFDASLLLILKKYVQKLKHYLAKPNVHCVFVSNHLRKNLIRQNIKLNLVSEVIYSNTDTDFYVRKSYEHSRKKIIFTQVSNFREKKGHIYTIQAFEKFYHNNPNVLFEVKFVGDLDQGYVDLVESVKGLSVFPKLSFCGKKNEIEIREILENSHIFIHNSITSKFKDEEGIPNAIMEAMSMELPVIATRHSGIPELVSDTTNLFLSNEKDVDEYVRNIQSALHAEYSRGNREAIINKFSKQLFKKNILQFYKNVLGYERRSFTQCQQCLLGIADDPKIDFNHKGVCSYCLHYEELELKNVKHGKEGELLLEQTIEKIKRSGINKPYDCIIGISGGVDSTYLALKAKEYGLRPLAVHFDNGWNSELAVSNIENVINKLGLDLHTFVVDWEEFRDLQLSFLKASVIDIELITDHAIITKLYQLALKYKIKYVLSGSNVVTEAVLPGAWIHDKRDHIHIKAIHKIFGNKKLKTFPLFSSMLKWRIEWSGIRSVSLLDLMVYNKKLVKEQIEKELNWRDYGGKHYESVFTRFYQGYILPVKFGVDKRRAHLSNLICSGQITRHEALEELKKPIYPPDLFKQDFQFILKKLGLSEDEFKKIIELPVKKHSDYPTEGNIYDRLPVLRVLRPFWLILKFLKRGV